MNGSRRRRVSQKGHLYASPASTSALRYIGSNPCSIQRCATSSAAGTTRRCAISKRGSHGVSSTFASHMERASARPCSGPVRHAARQKPSSRASTTVAHAYSRTSRRRVCSQDSSPSGRPPGHPHRRPSSLISTTLSSAVIQKAFAPCAIPSGSAVGGSQAINQSPPLERTANSSPSHATECPDIVISIFDSFQRFYQYYFTIYWGRNCCNVNDPNVFFNTTVIFPNSVAKGFSRGVAEILALRQQLAILNRCRS